VSKHLRVLRETGLVVARDDGRQRLYRLNGLALKPIYDWVADFEQLWSERFARMDVVLAELAAAEARHDRDSSAEDSSAEDNSAEDNTAEDNTAEPEDGDVRNGD
jgi:DNA-binding transcriptional ArsR family regulator